MNESPIFSRTHDLLLWLIPQTIKFPRAHRFGLGERITRLVLDFQETLIAAGMSKRGDQFALLKRADIQLAQIRQHLRLCKDMEIISISQYEHVSRLLVETGRLLGGWQNTWLKTGQAEGGAGGAGRLLEQ